MKNIKAQKGTYILLALVQLALGVYLIIKPEQSFSVICYVIGGILIAYGIIKLFGYFTRDMYELAFQFDLAMGIISAVIGLLLLLRWERIMILFPAFVGVLFLIDGVFKIQTALDAKRFGLNKWWLILILAIAVGLAGLILLLRPIEATKWVMRLIGINLMLDGILNLWVVLYTVKEWKK